MLVQQADIPVWLDGIIAIDTLPAQLFEEISFEGQIYGCSFLFLLAWSRTNSLDGCVFVSVAKFTVAVFGRIKTIGKRLVAQFWTCFCSCRDQDRPHIKYDERFLVSGSERFHENWS